VSSERLPLDTIKGRVETGQGALVLTEQEMVESKVNQGANLYVGDAMGLAQLCTLLIVFHGLGDIAELTVQPPEGVHHTAGSQPTIPLSRDPYSVMQYPKSLAVITYSPMCERKVAEGQKLMKSIMDVSGDGQTISAEAHSTLKMSLPICL
jgi:hypothetical protein